MDWITPLDNIEELTQGTIVGNVNFGYEEDLVGIVLSNGCDLEHNHASYLIIAALYPASSIISSSREYLGLIDKNGYESSSSRQKTRVKEKLSDYIHHRAINRYYFIDCTECELGMYMMIDFQQIISIPINEKSNLKPIANLCTPLKEQMIMQFVSYTSRIPTDRVASDVETLIVDTLIKEICENEE